eukprot:SAG25_NODE_31_length_20541_cov_59.033069_10_plen_77_part_00
MGSIRYVPPLICDDDADDGFLSYAMCSHAATVYSGGGGAPLLRLPVCVRAWWLVLQRPSIRPSAPRSLSFGQCSSE